MKRDEVREQIEALRAEVRALGDSFATLRQEDVRQVFVAQVRPVLIERADRGLREVPRKELSAEDRKACQAAITDWVDGAMAALESDDPDALPAYLERNNARSAIGQWQRTALDEVMDGLEAQVRSYQQTIDDVLRPYPISGMARKAKKIDPAIVEEILTPLSNALRIDLLERLSARDHGLAELSRATGRQKGHLQFHIKALADGGYIAQDRKSRKYSATARGRRALEGLTTLVQTVEGR
jgi:DNA-binding transcriptional ArsR family regulator